jgi:hypothetical protein
MLGKASPGSMLFVLEMPPDVGDILRLTSCRQAHTIR